MATPTTETLTGISSTMSATPSCITMIPASNGYVPPEACNAQWAYDPSFPAAVAFTVLFGIATLAHVVLAFAFRKGFCWVIIMGTAWELVAFTVRSIGSRNQQQQTLAIIAQLFFLLAPLWINAFVYMAVGRLVYTFHPDKRVWGFKAVSLGKYFVWLDIVSFLIQATGGSMLNPGSDAKTQNLGKNIYMSGVGVQQFFIFLFIGIIVRFHLDALRLEREGRLPNNTYTRSPSMWKYLTYSLYAVLVLITIRIIFRLAEFSGGVDPAKNSLPFKEGYALGLDAFPMMLATFILAIVHPGQVLKGPESEFPSRKERKAEKKAKKEEKKRIKQAKKTGDYAYAGTQHKGYQVRESGELLSSRDVEMGTISRDGHVARY